MTVQTVYSPDLAGIEVGETAISAVNGQAGVLSYRGYPIEDLTDKPFMQVVWLVLFGQWPSTEQEIALKEFIALHSSLSRAELVLLKNMPRDLHPMLMLQAMVPLVNITPKDSIEGLSPDAEHGLIIAAKLPSLVAAWHQLELGQQPIYSNAQLGFNENFLMMFSGQSPNHKQVKALDTAQILQMEHSYNAGTFAGRVCASTKAPIQSSISASIGTLFGVLHGGADQAALEMAKHIGTPDKAATYVQERLANRQKIMGMGHREYRALDPRAKLLLPMAKTLCTKGSAKQLLGILLAVETACQDAFEKEGKSIWANVEFYKGAVFYQLGIPPKYFTAIFAMARVYGYIAHFLEFSENSKLIRPRARYVGR